jgi:hypothetical protein
MKPLFIEPTKDSPRVELDPEKGTFLFSEKSLFEDALGFYEPIIKWFELYREKPKSHSIFDFKFEYFNTISAKQIYQIFREILEISKNSEVLVRWHYREIDEDMKAKGEEYAAMIPVNFELIVYN